jgi:hypothetical protein
MAQKRLDQIRTAVDLELRTFFSLQGCDAKMLEGLRSDLSRR